MFQLGEFIGISYAADLIDKLEKIIAPSLATGKIVITHRYHICCLAYSRAMGRSKAIDKILSLCPQPDLQIYLALSEEAAFKRVKERSLRTGEAICDKERYEVLKEARKNYEEIINSERENIVVINSERDIEIVKNDINKELEKLLLAQ